MFDVVLVSGSRGITDKELVYRLLDSSDLSGYEYVLQGGARGVDTLAAEWARDRGMRTITQPADWKNYGRSAGMIRNNSMLRQVRRVVCIWNGSSPGTAHTIEQAKKMGKRLTVFKVSQKKGN